MVAIFAIGHIKYTSNIAQNDIGSYLGIYMCMYIYTHMYMYINIHIFTCNVWGEMSSLTKVFCPWVCWRLRGSHPASQPVPCFKRGLKFFRNQLSVATCPSATD